MLQLLLVVLEVLEEGEDTRSRLDNREKKAQARGGAEACVFEEVLAADARSVSKVVEWLDYTARAEGNPAMAGIPY